MAATFMGKYAFQSTNPTGPTYFLRVQTRDDSSAPVMNGTSPPPTASEERFITYDAGGGARTIMNVADLTGAQQSFYVDDGTGWVLMTEAGHDPPATPIRWSNATLDHVSWTYVTKSGHARSMRYTVGGEEAFLIFEDPPPAPARSAGMLSELRCIELAPGVARMQQTRLATRGDFRNVDLTGADLSGIDFTDADFSDAILTGAKFVGSTLIDATFLRAALSGVSFERAVLDGAKFNGVDLRGVIWGGLRSARKTFFVGCLATGAQMGSSDPKQAADLTGSDLSQADFTDANLTNLTLESAVLDGTGLVGATLDGARLSRAIIRGVNLTDASLVGAKMAGVQSVVVLFRLTKPDDVAALVSYLNADDTLRIRTVFSNNGAELDGQLSATVQVPDRVWTVVQIADGTTFVVQRPNDALGTLVVYKQVTTPATLTNAYLPGVDLSNAHLTGVVAPGLHLYGSGASLAQADLSDAILTGANLGGLSLDQASLYGTDLQDAILVGASLKKAQLSRSPARPGAILIGANLAGADFTDASLAGANLSNASVAIPVDTAHPEIGGVFLFAVTADQDAYRSELSAWQLMLGAEYESDLTPGKPIGSRLAQAISQHTTLPGDHRVALGTGEEDVWLVSSPSSPGFGLTLWDGLDDQLNEHLFVRPSIPRLGALFSQHHVTLSSKTAVAGDAAGWWIDNDSVDLAATDTGYVRFRVLPDVAVPPNLVVYGTRLRVRRVQDGQLATYTQDFGPTLLTASQLDASTHCPDCRVRGDAQTAQKSWATRMRARQVARPPSCVPASGLACPRPSGF